MANERQVLVDYLIERIGMLRQPDGRTAQELVTDVEASDYPILCRSILVSAEDPSNFGAEDLPAISYGYGTAANNPAVAPGTQFRGETFTFLINVIFEKFPGDEHLANTAARWHDTIAMVVPRMNVNIVKGTTNVSVRGTRLASVTAFSQGLSDREFLQFAIDIDWTYPINP